jgi:FkbM family methyltransferase
MNLIFDIGANIGGFSDKCLVEHENCKIIIIEPNDRLFEILKFKYKDKNVVVLNDVVSTKNNETIDFYISNADTISTASTQWINESRFSNSYVWFEPIKKKSVNIDNLIERFGSPDLIKIDVEGHELQVILGLTSKQNKICFEWAEEEYENINKTCEYLQNLGYSEFGFAYGDEYLKEADTYSEWNKCEIHKDINIKRKEKWGMIWVK